MEKEAMVILGQNKRKVQYRAGCCLNDLIKAVEKKFSNVLAENNQRVFLLQQWDNDYKEYEDICDEQPDIPDKSKIMAKTRAREPVPVEAKQRKEPVSADPKETKETKEPVSADPKETKELLTEVAKEPASTEAVPDGQPPKAEESTDNGETPKYPICTGAPEKDDLKSKEVIETSNGGAAAHVSRKKIWEGREALKVYFMNPDELDGWKSRGEPMNMSTVLAWARVWNVPFFSDTIPYLSWTEVAEKADIRVKFSQTGGNWSMVGRDAENVIDKSKPTMMLNLLSHPAILQESLVIHEFGHALGLEHEHQRSDFWDVVGKHIDIDVMKSDTFVNPRRESDGGQSFGKDWFKDTKALEEKKGCPEESMPEYDPDSIMHYWFKVDWIQDESHHSEESIESDTSLTTKEKKYLKGIVKRSQGGQLLKHPSKNDYKALVEAYGKKFIAPENFDTTITRKEKSTIGGDGILRVDVNFRHIRTITWEVRSLWRQIGEELGLTEGDVDAIDANHHKVEDKYGDVLKKWMHTGKAKTDQLIDALRSPTVKRADIADMITASTGEKRKTLGLPIP